MGITSSPRNMSLVIAERDGRSFALLYPSDWRGQTSSSLSHYNWQD